MYLTNSSAGAMSIYDVLSAQPSLDAKQIQRKAFKLTMSVGKNRHFRMDEILPRHFIQSAEISGVGASIVRSIFADLVEKFGTVFADVKKALPKGFPEELTKSIEAAAEQRIGLLRDA